MDKKTNISKQINLDYFEFPANKLKSKLVATKFLFFNQKYELSQPAVFVCNKTTPYDKYLISSIMVGNYVFLKDDVIQALYKNALSVAAKKEIFKQFELFKEYGYSVIIFPEKNITIFGNCSKLPSVITEFLFETGFELKFLYLIGTYYSSPIWSKLHRKTETRYFQQFKIEHDAINNKSETERNKIINNLMPSSASVYASKFPLALKSNMLAENIDSIMYCCPHCKNFFSIYSEYNCIKCRECGTLVEFSKDGKILFSNTITSFDDIEQFLYNELKHKEFDNNPLVCYDTAIMLSNSNKGKPIKTPNTEVKIYADMVKIKNELVNKTIKISDIQEVILQHNNIVRIILKKDTILLQGSSKENFYILLDLVKMFKE